MVTKELEANKKCCLYASDYHLEMILLPYIKENLNKCNFIIMTQNDLSETIKVLLNRVNITKEEKNDIISINWKDKNEININDIRNMIKNNIKLNIIIKGDNTYIQKINNDLKSLVSENLCIIDCLSIDNNTNIKDIEKKYKEILNTIKID